MKISKELLFKLLKELDPESESTSMLLDEWIGDHRTFWSKSLNSYQFVEHIKGGSIVTETGATLSFKDVSTLDDCNKFSMENDLC